MPGNQASAVPQGDIRRRARPESEDVTDQPAATRRRDEERQRPQWTMRSTVEEILQEGSNGMANMKLNDFLRNYFGGTAAVDEDHNVTMQAFVRRPNAYVQDQQLLRRIFNLTAYKKLEQRKILLETINKLHHEGVFFLEQWRDYEGKDTITPFPKAKLNAVLTQVLREKRREAEERLRRTQEMKFTIFTNIEDVLFKGRVRVKEMKLNDFLTMELDGEGVVATNRSVLLEEFFKEPTKYIRDKGVLKEIQITDRYLRMEETVREETDKDEDVRKLQYNHVSTLLGWLVAAAEVKESVHNFTKQSLDAALEDVRISMRTSAAMKLEGVYESVYNARWHHVVEVPGGEGTGMDVKRGEPPQSWTYKAVGRTLEKDDGVEQSGAPRPRLLVLTSDKGWPYTWNRKGVEFTRDCHVNCEVERVWQIVKGDLTELCSPHGEADFEPGRRVLIGTPGIGKSMAAGSYLLYQLLHYDAEQLPMVVYFIADRKFLFDKTSRTVSTYMSDSSNASLVRSLSDRGMKGYIIYDVAEPDDEPSGNLAPRGWGMVLVSPPLEGNYKEWVKRSGATKIVMNCPGESDVKAMCVWMRRHQPVREQAEYWHVVKGQMDEVGPIPRYIFDERKYDNWVQRCHKIVDEATSSVILQYSGLGCGVSWDCKKVLYWLARVVRVRDGRFGFEFFFNLPVSAHLGNKTLFKSAKLMQQHDFNLLISELTDYLISENFGRSTVFAFLNGSFVRAIGRRLRELRPSPQRQSHCCALAVYSQERSAGHHVLPPLEHFSERIDVECGVLYVTEVENFPLVDAFFFVKLNPMTLVGLRMATAGGHHTTASTARQFTECLAEYFNGWDELSRKLSWEIIYVQHADSTPMNDWQRCDVVDANNVSDDEKKIAAFWNEKVRQYQVSISSEDAPRRH
ncbi:putative retrotransposon hot spot (RHS) protein [Trypanosoma cruzi]|uniref:Retrotransposon hot spot (RHS) protein, putative n=2 Tax=Trypanosoma cruzi TaxID=5693 RepID=Q4DPW1_TRYCC|nr:retrotransposon hot spot (RHS) protein, putative [Trypanosoma cruzi]EAN94562.1 retrotransposon hot spot (RHS) protein, putative [Trypanosoma cruzi]PWV07354.1 putative retrotransposon hot spot (RHS) protein [Trypanosoma cruzi]|eukprot:XP_816413.1 retrotransposon hot spot (RHS) protein [Trypanosoma cruzi strain CL Brener]